MNPISFEFIRTIWEKEGKNTKNKVFFCLKIELIWHNDSKYDFDLLKNLLEIFHLTFCFIQICNDMSVLSSKIHVCMKLHLLSRADSFVGNLLDCWYLYDLNTRYVRIFSSNSHVNEYYVFIHMLHSTV